MDTKELKGLPGMGENDVITIWKMNFGFKNDMTAESLTIEIDSTGKKKATMNPAKAKLAWLIYGILEAESLGLKTITDVAGGLSEAETKFRTRAIRGTDHILIEAIYDEIQKLNTPEEEKEVNAIKND